MSHCNQNFFCVENLKKIFYSFSLALSCAVWPDVAIKNSPILSKSCPKIQQWIFLLMYIRFFKKPKKSPNFGYFFKNIRFRSFQKSPNLVTLLLCSKSSTIERPSHAKFYFQLLKSFSNKLGHFRPLSHYFRIFNTVESKLKWPMTVLELRVSGVGGDRSTTEPQPLPFYYQCSVIRPCDVRGLWCSMFKYPKYVDECQHLCAAHWPPPFTYISCKRLNTPWL